MKWRKMHRNKKREHKPKEQFITLPNEPNCFIVSKATWEWYIATKDRSGPTKGLTP